MKNYRTLLPYFRENKWYVITGFVALLIVDGLQLLIPRVIKWAVDDLTGGQITSTHLLRYAGYIVALALIIGIMRYFWRLFIMGTSRRIEESLRNQFFGHLQTLSFRYYDNTKTGDLMAHSINDMLAVRMATGIGLVALTDAVVLGLAALAFMFLIDVKLTLFALIPMPLIALVTLRFAKLLHVRFTRVQETFSNLTEKVRESISGIRVVKAYVQEDHEIGRFSEVNQEYVNKNMFLIRIWGMFFPLIMLFSGLSLGIVLLFGGRQVILHQITAGDFVAFTNYIGILTWPMMALGWVVNLLQRGSASMGRINHILETEPEIRDEPGAMELKSLRGEIEFRHLTFSYDPGLDPSLRDIDLRIPAGSTLGLLGRTGSGKSTLINLILRLYQPEPGQVLIDGHDVRSLTLSTIRENVGYVPQETFLFSDTIRENVAFGKLDVADEIIDRMLDIAGIREEILEFPKGYDTVLGERGVTLSGGQKQRLALARALTKDPSVLILDDAMSSVDTHTEERILKGLKEFMRDRTTILVSHRISTLKNADAIAVLEDAELKELGSHDELIREKGIYYNMYCIQQLEEELEEIAER
jgi:ATP-binding cassette subfamily B protein